MSQALTAVIKATMTPLVERFGLQVKREVDQRNYAEVLFVNRTTGLKVAVDWYEFRPFVRLFQLEGGDLPPEPSSYEGPEQLREFDADDLVLFRSGRTGPVGKMVGSRDDAAVAHLLSEYATALALDAADVLDGDFTVFAALDGVVKERAARMRSGRT